MKKNVYSLVNALLIGLMMATATGCKKDKKEDPAPIVTGQTNAQLSFVIDGDGFNNKSYSNTNGVSLAFYDVSGENTAVGINVGDANSNNYVGFALDFDGNSTGTYKIGDDLDESEEDKNVYLIFNIKDGATDKSYIAKEGTITITRYQSVGGKIEGTFSGTLSRVGSTEIATVKNGAFSATRLQDQQ